MFDIEKARQAEELAAQCLSDLCHARRRWEMHIPLQSDDPDVLLGDALGQLRGAIKEVEQQRQLAEAAEKRLVQAEWGDVGFCPHCHADELRSSDDEYNDEQHLYVNVYRCGACGAMWAGDIKQGIDLAKQLAAATARAEAAEAKLALVPAYADYYASVVAQGDAPYTFDEWRNGANRELNPYATHP